MTIRQHVFCLVQQRLCFCLDRRTNLVGFRCNTRFRQLPFPPSPHRRCGAVGHLGLASGLDTFFSFSRTGTCNVGLSLGCRRSRDFLYKLNRLFHFGGFNFPLPLTSSLRRSIS